MAEPWTLGPVLVTGGTGRIGLAIARAFLRAGARAVVAVGSTEARARDAAAALRGHGARAEARAADVSDPAAVESLFADIAGRHGTVAVLVNAAGINFNRLIRDLTPEDFDRVMAVNARSAFLCSRAACTAMAASGLAGRIVNVTSGNYRYVRPGSALYSASKAAMEMLTRAFALEFGPQGIVVNAVAPGLVDQPGNDDPGFLAVADYYRARSPQQALVTAEDVAEAVQFLASERAARIAGETIVLDAGFSACRFDFPRRAP
jgi:3-oxoacyl-[acyl-carrier protein] reductase